MLHWLFSARGPVPLQAFVLAYQASSVGGVLTIPAGGTTHGADVFRIWQIYPATKELLYYSPFSPVVGGGGIPIPRQNWTKDTGGNVKITLPSGTPAGSSSPYQPRTS